MNAINWLIEKCEIEESEVEYFEGYGMVKTISGYFKGTLPSRMVQEIHAYLKTIETNYSDGSSYSNRSWGNDEVDYSFKTGVYKSTQNSVIFTFNRYEIVS